MSNLMFIGMALLVTWAWGEWSYRMGRRDGMRVSFLRLAVAPRRQPDVATPKPPQEGAGAGECVGRSTTPAEVLQAPRRREICPQWPNVTSYPFPPVPPEREPTCGVDVRRERLDHRPQARGGGAECKAEAGPG